MSVHPNEMFVPYLTYLTVPDKVTVIMTIKKPGAILLAAVIVSCDYLLSALSCHILHYSSLTGACRRFNFIVDYVLECREEEQFSCIK